MSYCRITRQWLPASEMKIVMNEYGNKILVAKKVPTSICDECGREVLCGRTTVYTSTRILSLCPECLDAEDEYGNRKYECCHDCGNYYEVDYNIAWMECIEDYVCDDCASDNYRECYQCGHFDAIDNMVYTYEGNYYCEDCRNDLYICEDCGRWIEDPDNVYYEDDDEYSENPLCRDCYDKKASKIHSYGYKPEPKFNRLCNEKKTEEYFGMEIEVSGNSAYSEQFLEAFGDEYEDQIYLKRDGSVCGFEIVTHPMTRRYFYSKFVPNLRKGMAFLRTHEFAGHNKAGIHIHVSSKAISDEQYRKLICLLYPEQESIYKNWLAITQRHDDKMNEWSTMKLRDDQGARTFKASKKYKKKIKEEIKDFGSGYYCKPPIGSTRYSAINPTRETVEFRIFNSNIRPERIIKNAQVILSLLDFTKTNALPTYHNYIRFIEDNRGEYRELWDFLIEKKIVQPREQREEYKKVRAALRKIDDSLFSYEDITNKLNSVKPAKVTGIDDNDERSNMQCVSQF